jgi:hypothetical protein
LEAEKLKEISLYSQIYTHKQAIITMAEAFNNSIRAILTTIRDNPQVLNTCDPVIVTKLQSQGKPNSQATSNAVTVQEGAFASLLEANGFQFLSKPKKNDHLKGISSGLTTNGFYYIYQVNGSQQSIDFQAMIVHDKKIEKFINFDLKHTTNDIIFLNDGWFEDNVIYVVSWNTKTFIGLGQNVPTEIDAELMKKVITLKKELNKNKEATKYLSVTMRCANRYSCKQFTPEFTTDCFTKVCNSL